jgi:hypothetical protein
VLGELSGDRNCYIAALCTLYILVTASDGEITTGLLDREPVRSFVKRAEAPLAKALAPFACATAGSDAAVTTWKAAYRECERGHLTLPALLLWPAHRPHIQRFAAPSTRLGVPQTGAQARGVPWARPIPCGIRP